ncbi:MAG: M48 family metalloprotease [Chloroflexota bacterium]
MSTFLPPSESELDPARQEQARHYARLERRLMLLDLALGSAYLLTWLAGGWSQRLKAALQALSAPYPYLDHPWLQVAGFAAVFFGLLFLLDLPLNFYSSYVLPKRFGLSTQSLSGWLGDLLKSGLIGGLLGLLVLEVIYAVLRAAPQTWWLWAAAFLLLFNVLLANLAPLLLMPLFYKFTPLGEAYADLEARLLRLAEQAGVSLRGVYQFDMSRRTKAANAALTGLGNTRRILLGDTLLREFSPDEIETVLAHELAHHLHKDIPLGIAVQSLLTLLGLYLASVGLKVGTAALGFAGPADFAALPLFVLVIGLYSLVTLPLGNAYSRWRERLADEYALHATGNGSAFASAMTRLANQNLAEADPEPWVEFLLHSHPALNKRIALARQFSPVSEPAPPPAPNP